MTPGALLALNWVNHEWGRCVICFDCGFSSGACRIIFFITLSSDDCATELPPAKNWWGSGVVAKGALEVSGDAFKRFEMMGQ